MRIALFMMYASYAVRGLVPILIAPFLIRTLHNANWGVFSLIYAFCLLLSQVIEFGFGLTATRDVAIHRDDRNRLSEILSSVVVAQILLMLVICVVSYPIFMALHLSDHLELLLPALVYIFFQGTMPLWFFRGMERLVTVASLEICSKLAIILLTPFAVHSPNDLPLAVCILAAGSVIPSSVSFILAFRTASFVYPERSMVRAAIVDAVPLFLVRISGLALTVGNTILLGLFVAPSLVGFFAGVERVVTGLRAMMNPAIDTLFPRIARIVAGKSDEQHIIRRSILGMIAFGFTMSVALWLFSGSLTKYLFGSALAVPLEVTRILAAGPALIGITHAIGTQWLYPQGEKKIYTSAILIGSSINFIGLAGLLQFWPQHGPFLAATATIAGQFVMSAILVFAALRIGRNPFAASRHPVDVLTAGEPSSSL